MSESSRMSRRVRAAELASHDRTGFRLPLGRSSIRRGSTPSPRSPKTSSSSTSIRSGGQETPFGGTIAHGFLSLSLLSAMAYSALPKLEGAATA